MTVRVVTCSLFEPQAQQAQVVQNAAQKTQGCGCNGGNRNNQQNKPAVIPKPVNKVPVQPVKQVAPIRPVQQPARPVQHPARPVQQPAPVKAPVVNRVAPKMPVKAGQNPQQVNPMMMRNRRWQARAEMMQQRQAQLQQAQAQRVK